jgi:hypothetical protein
LGLDEEIRSALRVVIAGPATAAMQDFIICLGALSLHFWRPDFTPEQAKLIFGDFSRDLAGVTSDELTDACAEWRKNPKNRFFPTPGQLLELVQSRLSARARDKAGAGRLLAIMEGGADSADYHSPAPRNFSEIMQKLTPNPPAPAPETPPPDTDRPETPESRSELRDKLADRRGGRAA